MWNIEKRKMQTTLFDLKKTFPIKKGKVKIENYEEFVEKLKRRLK